MAAAPPDASAGAVPSDAASATSHPPPAAPNPAPVPPSTVPPGTVPSTSGDTPPPPPPPPPIDIGATIKAAYESAENAQGPLDGRWRLSGSDGADLFAFVMADTGGAPSSRAASPDNPAIEGAWRDLRRQGGLGDSGLLQSVAHIADRVEIRFYEADPSAPTVVKLRIDAAGVWSGDLVEAGSSRPVVMRRF
jgi:hypothetical protein